MSEPRPFGGGDRKPPQRRGRTRKGATRRRADDSSHAGARRGAPAHHDTRPGLHLTDDIVAELRATARPGKAEILVQVFGQAAAAFAAGDLDDAIRFAEQSKHIALRSVVVRELLGLAFYRRGRWKDAARELAAFRRLSGSTEQNPVLADCYRAQGRPQRALELCDEIEPSAGPDVVFEGAIVAAGALADMGRLDEAIARLQALDLQPGVAEQRHVRAWYALGDLLQRRGRFTQALEWFEAAADSDPEGTDAADRVRRLRRRTRP